MKSRLVVSVVVQDEISGSTIVSRVELSPSQIEPFGNPAIVAAAQQAAASLLRRQTFEPWVEHIDPKIRRFLRGHPGNVHTG